MSNMNKILITVVVCVFMICVAAVSIVKIVTPKTDAPTVPADTSVSDTSEGTVDASEPLSGDASDLTTETTAPTGVTSGTAASVTASTSASADVTAPAGDIATAILGKWTDSLGMMGFEFFDDGTVNTTYFDLKQLVGLDLSGSTKLPYTLEGDILTIKFTAYAGSAQWKFRVSVNGNELTMYNLEEHSTSVYTKAG